MLTSDQLSDLEAAQRDVTNKKMVLDTAVDVQALLRLLVEKEVISKNEMRKFREEVRNSPKYKNAIDFVKQTLGEISMYKNNPQELLREMLRRKSEGK